MAIRKAVRDDSKIGEAPALKHRTMPRVVLHVERPKIEKTVIVEPKKQLTVAELILHLQGLKQDALVSTEGCDCYGEAGGIEYYSDNTVLITRTGGA